MSSTLNTQTTQMTPWLSPRNRDLAIAKRRSTCGIAAAVAMSEAAVASSIVRKHAVVGNEGTQQGVPN